MDADIKKDSLRPSNTSRISLSHTQKKNVEAH